MGVAFLSALRFLTVIPVGSNIPFSPNGVVPFFPVVGLCVGGLLVVFDTITSSLFSEPATALLNVLFLAVVTGAIHLDGLADTADGFFSHRPPEQVLSIMKDSRVGVMGVIALIAVLSLKWAGLFGLSGHPYKMPILLVVPAFARASMVLGFHFLPYGRPEGGLGRDFYDPENPRRFTAAIPILLIVLFTGWMLFPFLVVLLSVFLLVTFGTLRVYRARLGCITGDMLGALTEINESVLFLALSASVGKTGGLA